MKKEERQTRRQSCTARPPAPSPASGRELTFLPIPRPEGKFLAGYSEHGLARLLFPAHPQGNRLTSVPLSTRSPIPSRLRRWHRLTARAVQAALRGAKVGESPPLDLPEATPFQQQVWSALLGIAPGQTTSYGALARSLGRPAAARAVGQACGANPIPLLIPCHRVLAAGGGIGGFSGGLDWKQHLLRAEAKTRSEPRSSGGAGRSRVG